VTAILGCFPGDDQAGNPQRVKLDKNRDRGWTETSRDSVFPRTVTAIFGCFPGDDQAGNPQRVKLDKNRDREWTEKNTCLYLWSCYYY
jgi:hypothetical protein